MSQTNLISNLSDILCLLTCSLSVQLKDGSYDLLRPIVDNGGRKKCLPTLDFLLTPARALCMPAAHIGLSFAAARDHWYYWERVSSTSAAPLCDIALPPRYTLCACPLSGLSCHRLDKYVCPGKQDYRHWVKENLKTTLCQSLSFAIRTAP